MLVPDGVYRRALDGRVQFVQVPAPSEVDLGPLVRTIAERIGRSLERADLITRNIENAYLPADPGEGAPINAVLGHSITYRIATGPREGQKVFALQTLAADPEASRPNAAECLGFSLHAGVSTKAGEPEKLEHLARYISRPGVATERLALTDSGHVRYTLKAPYRDGTTHVVFEPLDFIAPLAVLLPKPRVHLTRYHRVFAPDSALRDRVVPKPRAGPATAESTELERHRSMTWAKRLKRVFAIEIEQCLHCGGTPKVIPSIEQADVIERILEHLRSDSEPLNPP